MKYLLSIALLTFVGCKNDDSTGDLKTLDQLAGSKNVYTCQSEDPTNYPSAELIQRIVIGNTKCDAKAMSSDCKEVAKAVATVPKVFQNAFYELGGSIKVGGDTDQICGVTLKKAEVVGAEKVSGISSCWAIAASDRDQDNSPSKVVVIAHKDVTSAKQYTTRVFGYFASQALPYVNPDGTGYKFDFSNIANKNIAAKLTENKVSVANQFVREINKSGEYSLTSMSSVLGEALDYVKINGVVVPEIDAMDQTVKNRILAFSDYVSADAFDSMFCGAASNDAKLAKANTVFEDTIADYKTKVHPALLQLATSIAGNGMNLTTTAGSADLAALLQILGIGAAALKSMPNPALQVAASADTSLANNTTVGSCTCGSCQGCANGNCSCANGSCCAGGCCGPNCQCGGTCANCGPSTV
jgi:hypothetical protein